MLSMAPLNATMTRLPRQDDSAFFGEEPMLLSPPPPGRRFTSQEALSAQRGKEPRCFLPNLARPTAVPYLLFGSPNAFSQPG